jgi:hypothetical protein
MHLIHGYSVDKSNPNSKLLSEKKFDDLLAIYSSNTKLTSSDLNILGVALRSKCKYMQAYNAFMTSMKSDQNTHAFFNLGKLIGELTCFFRREDIFNSITGQPNLPNLDNIQFSCFDEDKILQDLISKLGITNNFFVDIGAGDGVTFSNTFPLVLKGFHGICIEPEGDSFYSLAYHLRDSSNVTLLKEFITPHNVLKLLDSLNAPKDFAFLSLDIDSYDYYVLQELLKKYSPSIICTEINELFPPPIKFALKFQNQNQDISTKFLGHSVSMVEELLAQNGYRIVNLEYNNLFAVRNDLLIGTGIEPINGQQAYKSGFCDKQDWYLKFIWNGQKLNEILTLQPDQYSRYFHLLHEDPDYFFSLN